MYMCGIVEHLTGVSDIVTMVTSWCCKYSVVKVTSDFEDKHRYLMKYCSDKKNVGQWSDMCHEDTQINIGHIRWCKIFKTKNDQMPLDILTVKKLRKLQR